MKVEKNGSKLFKLLKLSTYCFGIIFIMLICINIYLNIKYNIYMRQGGILDTNYINHESIANILGIFAMILLFIIINVFILYMLNKEKVNNKPVNNKKVNKVKEKNTISFKKIVNLFFLFFSIILMLVWINLSYGEAWSDSYDSLNAAIETFKGGSYNYWYFLKYPFQLGLVNYELLFISIIGVKEMHSAELLLKYINLVELILSFVMLIHIYKKFILENVQNMNPKFKDSNISLFIIMFNVPVIMLVTFIYGDIPTIFFSLITSLLVLYAFKCNKSYLILLATLPMMLAIYVRQNSFIILIALSIVILFNIIAEFVETKKELIEEKFIEEKALKKSKSKTMLIIFSLIFVTSSAFIPKYVIWQESLKLQSHEKEYVEQIPLKNHIAMGLADGKIAPGWFEFSVADNSYVKPKINNEFYSKFIKDRLNKFLSDPIYAFKFFEIKLATTWAEPTYNGMYYNTLVRAVEGKDFNEYFKERIKDNNIINSLYYGFGKNALEFYAKMLIMITYIFAAVYIIYLIRKKAKISNAELLLILIFVGGFAFHFISETKGRYIMIYNLVITPLALAGIMISSNLILEKIMKSISLKNDKKINKNEYKDKNKNKKIEATND